MDKSHDSSARVTQDLTATMNGFSDSGNAQKEKPGNENSRITSVDSELDSWNPMEEDYSNLAFNDYREPTTEELRQWMPKPGNPGPSEDLMACYRNKDGDVRLYISGIPIEVTQEGVKGLFSQVGKVVYCKVIPQRDPSRIDKFGFIGYNSYREAEHAIRKFDGFSLGENMRIRVSLSKDRPKLPDIKPRLNEDFSYSRQENGLDEKSEINDLDWGPPAVPLNLGVDNGMTPQQDEQLMVSDENRSLKTEASGCNGEVKYQSSVQDISNPASKKPIAPILELLPCSKCGKEGRRRCGSCKIPYCSKECQRSHWPEHKKLCNWKISDEKSGKSLLASKNTTEENNSAIDVANSKEIEERGTSKHDLVPDNPTEEPYTITDEDIEITEAIKFANMMGMRVSSQSPIESPSPQDSPINNFESRERLLSSPQESHYGYLKPFKAASPKPLITELPSAVSPVSEHEGAEGLKHGSSSDIPDTNQVSKPCDASPSAINPQSEKQTPEMPVKERIIEEQRPYKRYYDSEVPRENISIGNSYQIVATSVSSPTLFWAQLYESSALASQSYLFETIRAEYENTPYKNYVPSANELCIAQYSNDGNWYRSKVDYIGNNGLIRVTHIDFGSSEDVDPSKIRRIKEYLVHIPRQAIKCALDFPECSTLSREWSQEMIEDFKSKVLDVKCRAEVKNIKGSVFHLDVYDSNNTKLNDIFKEKLLEKSTSNPLPVYPLSSSVPPVSIEDVSSSASEFSHGSLEEPLKSSTTDTNSQGSSETCGQSPGSTRGVCTSAESQISETSSRSALQNYPTDVGARRNSIAEQDKSQLVSSMDTEFESVEIPVADSQSFLSAGHLFQDLYYQRPTNPHNFDSTPKENGRKTGVEKSGQESPCSTPEGSLSSRSSSKSGSELDFRSPVLQPLMQKNPGLVHGLPFKAIVTSVKSPWEFTVKLSEPNAVEQLESLTRDLNIHCSNAPFEDKAYSFGEACAAKLNKDHIWHRGKVLASCQQEGYMVSFVDLGIDQVVSSQNMRSIPEHFKGLEPQCFLCSLGGVRKPAGSLIWGKEARERFASLVLQKSFTFKEISRYKQTHIVELLDESAQPSVAKELIDAGLADAYVKKVQRIPVTKDTSKPLALPMHFKSAISSAKLPSSNNIFQVTATEIESPGIFFVQLVDKEMNQRLAELCNEMNKYYTDSTTHPDWQARETQLCAASFKGSWFRAYVESVDADNAAKIYCVDFGNSEVVSTSALRPLASTFLTLPYCALKCSLANIETVQGEEWSKEATNFMKLKIPISSTLNARLVFKGQSILFVDVFVSSGKTTESLVKMLVAKGLAKYKSKKDVRSPGMSSGVVKERIEDKIGSRKFGMSLNSLSVYGCAIAAAKLPNDMETFEAVVTEVMPSGEFFIHMADEGLAVQLIELTKRMNSYYNAVNPNTFDAKQNLLCAAKYSNDWRRAYILELNSDQTAKVYDVDFGKTETLPVSRLQFLQPQFTMLQYFALRCKLSMPRGMNWSREAYELFMSKIQLLVPVNLKLFAKRREIMFVDVLIPETGESLSQILISQTQERKSQPLEGRPQPKLPNSPKISQTSKETKAASPQRIHKAQDQKRLNFEKALASLTLPSEGQMFNAVITEFQSPQCFYIHSDVEMAVKLTNLSSDMNNHYNTIPRTPFQPKENQLCVALFESPNDWYRALVEKISSDQIATVFFVDYGNTNNVPLGELRPIEERFVSLPYCALHTSLAHIQPIDSSGWTRNAIDSIKAKLPIGTGLFLKLISKQQDTLYVDLVDSSSADGSLIADLVNSGLARYSTVNEETSPSSTSGGSDSKKPLISPLESAIASASLPPFKETFQVIATHVNSPGSFSVQIADYEMACKVAALGNEMNTHYNSVQYPPFQPEMNKLCAAQFTGNNEWYRGWIDGIVSDDNVHVYYPDYGNSEVLGYSRLRPLEKQFTTLPYLALTCSIGHVVPLEHDKWKQEAIDLFASKVLLYEPIDVKLVFKKNDCLFLDITDPQVSSATISKSLVEQGLAVWIQDSKRQTKEVDNDKQIKPHQDESKRVKLATNDRKSLPPVAQSSFSPISPQAKDPIQEYPAQVKSNASSPAPLKKHLMESVPSVSIPKGEFFNAVVCDIKKTGTISLQMLTQQLKELDNLCMEIGNHCCHVDNSSYCPAIGELCLACFSQDMNWYRAVVNDIFPNQQFRVTFVDFGNDDTLPPSDIRKVDEKFLQLPRQAYTGHIAGLPVSKTKDLLGDETFKALSDKLLDKRVFARVEVSTNELEFFSVGPDENPGASINKEVLQKNTASNTQTIPSILDSVENEFMAIVSEVLGTGELWVQRKDVITSLDNLKEDLTSYCESSRATALTILPPPGYVCLSKFNIDSKWYRAKIMESNSPDNILVQFVDYGNAEAVSLNDLREAKEEFLQFPFQGIKCYLAGVTQGNTDADEYVQQTILREMKVKVRERRTEKLGIELEDYEVPNGPFNINENLIAFGYSA